MTERIRLLQELDKLIANDATTEEMQDLLDRIYPKRVKKRQALAEKKESDLTKEERDYLIDIGKIKNRSQDEFSNAEIEKLINLRFEKKWPFRKIAIELGRSTQAVTTKFNRLVSKDQRVADLYKEEKRAKEMQQKEIEEQVLYLLSKGKTQKHIVEVVPGITHSGQVKRIREKYQMILGDRRVKKTIY